ncbi:hypothetical protein MHB44_20180 [Lysinibacillus sp. FSL H8-0500]|uniref:YhfM-like domain-containing protein n=1 Tax=Lysinibacillus macroides TaxID=33935 RepID=A0A0N0CVJ0_9BACI|nr:hypothetical protein [Lysinibacillus macroides]KOY81745.1 hypothetical protein ADM90_12535 [Lysinibacillus macroides]QPR67852.1 hypothetical protein I6G82_22195 [Lysinibacillus macroides]
MKKFSLMILSISISLFLISCSEEGQTEERFLFAGEIDKIIVTGKGVNRDLGTRTIDSDAEINVIKEAMQDVAVSSKFRTFEEALFELEVIFKDDLKETIDIWYYPSAKTSVFYTDKIYYSMNVSRVPALIKLFESFK